MNVRSKDKKQLILEATLALIAENGLHATPMSQISKRSGVSAGTIYHYFPSKEALINELYVDLKQVIAAAAFRGYNIQAPYPERFLLVWRNSLDYLISSPMQLSFIEQCSISPVISTEAKAASNKYLAPVIGFITEGIELGQLKKMDIQLMLTLINSAVVGTAKLQLSGALEITDEHREAAARACWDGVSTG
jgi:AcrR family transcriptional regulator